MRKLRIDDFSFVRKLASKYSNFTIPPIYVLWLLTKIKGDICLVAEEEGKGPVAYLLAVPIEDPLNSIFVWQLSSGIRSRGEPIIALLTKLHEITRKNRTRSILFSAIPDSAHFRVLRRHLGKVTRVAPRKTKLLPGIIAPGETEYRIDLR